jgi:hypothetical protein
MLGECDKKCDLATTGNFHTIKLKHLPISTTWVSFINIFMHGCFEAFCAQLIATCKWQPAQLSATCEWPNQHNFNMKKHGEIGFQKQAAFLSFAGKSHV